MDEKSVLFTHDYVSPIACPNCGVSPLADFRAYFSGSGDAYVAIGVGAYGTGIGNWLAVYSVLLGNQLNG